MKRCIGHKEKKTANYLTHNYINERCEAARALLRQQFYAFLMHLLATQHSYSYNYNLTCW